MTNAKILDKLSVFNLEKTIVNLIKNKKLRYKLQKLSIKNFYLTHQFITNKIDKFRTEKLKIVNKFYTRKSLENLRILHITNFNERLDGRLFNTGEELIMASLDLDIVF